MVAEVETIEKVSALAEKYKYGFVTDIETESAPKGLSEDIVRFISAKKNEPEWLLEWRLKAYRHWLTMEAPDWAKVGYPADRLPGFYYYSAPKVGDSRRDARRGRSRAARDLRKAGHSAARAGNAGGCAASVRWMRCSTPCRSRPPTRTSCRSGVIFLPISEAVEEASRTGAEISRFGGALSGQLLRER